MKTFRDVYKFPLRYDSVTYIWDQDNQMVAQFEIDGKDSINIIMDTLNGKRQLDKRNRFYHEKGEVKAVESDQTYITIRGWGNLTGIGGLNLSTEEAANIQDTFAEWIVETLNGENSSFNVLVVDDQESTALKFVDYENAINQIVETYPYVKPPDVPYNLLYAGEQKFICKGIKHRYIEEKDKEGNKVWICQCGKKL